MYARILSRKTLAGVPQLIRPGQVVARCVGAANFSTNLKADNFVNGSSSVYIENMLERWEKDPQSVHSSWDAYFRNIRAGYSPSQSFQSPLSLPKNLAQFIEPAVTRKPSSVPQSTEKYVRDHLAVQSIIRSYQVSGHRIADIDPLRQEPRRTEQKLAELQLDTYSLGAKELDEYYALPVTTFIGGKETELKLGEIVRRLEETYCGPIGIQYMFIPRRDQCDWIRNKFEVPGATDVQPEVKKLILKRLIEAAGLEAYITKKWPAEKKFGLEGCESLIPALQAVIDTSRSLGVESIVMGMSHRGRLNVIANICQKPLEQIFARFMDLQPDDSGSGDVKYHLGLSVDATNEATGLPITLSLCANPSHLETVDPVVQGRTRAEQFYREDKLGDKVMSIIMHGDAAFAGQGVVYETFHLSQLPDYTTHGAVHVVINNQVGFTTDPRVARSSAYCTDVARVVNAPIFHVNADNPEAVHYVAQVAALWRATFHRDVVIDLVGYRRNGHNEMDEPAFTQPVMYDVIRKKTVAVSEKYIKKMVDGGLVDKQQVEAEVNKYFDKCEAAYRAASAETSIHNADFIDSPWKFPKQPMDPAAFASTGVDEATLHHIGMAFSEKPDAVNVFTGKYKDGGIVKILRDRREMVKARTADWALGEALAWGSLLKEKVHVRLSGQDVERGTFSHRHHVLHDPERDLVSYRPLCHLWPDQAPYTVCNSSLSEYGVLGFEHGFSMANPNSLVMWEAQFGDFNNTAQTIIDQCISSGEAKWTRQSGIVMLLPHGYEGMGPEHSSARPERFLQLSSDNPDEFSSDPSPTFALNQLRDINWQIMNLTTPANFFHAMRRQLKMPFRKPLVIMTPKSLLRSPLARSSFDDMVVGSEFRRIYPDRGPAREDPAKVQRVVLCSGKVYYELERERNYRGLDRDIAIIRVEQISPFPYDLVREQLSIYSQARVIWTQEEPKNGGAWTYVQPRINNLLLDHMEDTRRIGYTRRIVSASPATGNKKQHLVEQAKLIDDALRLE